MTLSRRLTSGALALAGLSLVAACTAAPAPEPTDEGPVDLGTMTASLYQQASSAPAALAVAEGYTDELGLDLQFEWGASSQAILTSVIGGSAQVGTVSVPSVIEAVREGFDIRIVGEAFREVEGSQLLETLPDSGIESIADLAGRTVGVVGLRSGHDTRLRYVMDLEGLDMDAPEFIHVPFGEMAMALETGLIDAGVFTGPTLLLAKDTMNTRTVFDFGAGPLAGYSAMQWVMSGEFVDANPEAVAAFQCAVVVRGAKTATDDDALFEAAMIDGLGFSPEGFAAVVKPIYPAANDAKQMQKVADIFHQVGIIDEPFDVSEVTVPLPTNCG